MNTFRITAPSEDYNTNYAMDETMRIKKIEFKAGARNSFIEIFNRFQEKEAIMGAPSLSMANAILLHSGAVRGNAPSNSSNKARKQCA